MPKTAAEPVRDHFTPGEPDLYTAEEAARKAVKASQDAGPSDSPPEAPAAPAEAQE